MKKFFVLNVFSLIFGGLTFAHEIKPIMKTENKMAGKSYCSKIIITNLIKDSQNKAVTINRMDSLIVGQNAGQSHRDIQRDNMTYFSQYEIPVNTNVVNENQFSFSLPRIYLANKTSEKIHDIRHIDFEKMSCGKIYFVTLANKSTSGHLSLRAVVSSIPFDSQNEFAHLSQEIEKSHQKLQGLSLKRVLFENPFLTAKSFLNAMITASDLNKLIPGSAKLREAVSAHVNKIRGFFN